VPEFAFFTVLSKPDRPMPDDVVILSLHILKGGMRRLTGTVNATYVVLVLRTNAEHKKGH
jgi:hypothetical protein